MAQTIKKWTRKAEHGDQRIYERTKLVAVVAHADFTKRDQRRNADQIAAVPDMVNALEVALLGLEDEFYAEGAIVTVKAALRKAGIEPEEPED